MREVFASKCREFSRVCNSVRVTVASRRIHPERDTDANFRKPSSFETLGTRVDRLLLQRAVARPRTATWSRTRWLQIGRNRRSRNPKPSMWKLLHLLKVIFIPPLINFVAKTQFLNAFPNIRVISTTNRPILIFTLYLRLPMNSIF